MGLNPVEQQDSVGLGCVLVHINRLSAHTGQPHLYRLHGTLDGTPHRLFGDTVVGQNLGLAFGGGAAVAAHRGDDIGFSLLGLDKVHHSASHNSVMMDPPATTGNGDFHARLDLAAQGLPGQFQGHSGCDIRFGDMGVVKHLTYLDHLWHGYILDKISNGFQAIRPPILPYSYLRPYVSK